MMPYRSCETDAGHQHGLDRFGRVVDQLWYSGNALTDRFQFGYEPDSNRLYRLNLQGGSWASWYSELYHANGPNNGMYDPNNPSAGYDGFNQLQTFSRGMLNASNDTIASPSLTTTWAPSALGDSGQITTSVNGGAPTAQSRTYNQQNQITAAGAASLGSDNNGNLTGTENGEQLYFDAWNRLVAIKVTGSGPAVTLAAYQYDAEGRRIKETVLNSDGSTTARDVYFSAWGQAIEERVGGQVSAQYIWSPAGTNLLTRRDRDPDNSGSLSEIVYVQQDPLGNVTAIVSTSGTVLERVVYNPYGTPIFLYPDWSVPHSVSNYLMNYLFQGGRYQYVFVPLGSNPAPYSYDPSASFYIFGARDLSATLGRWVEMDPLGFGGGDLNMYRFAGNNPTNYTDPSGQIVPLVLLGVAVWAGGMGTLGFAHSQYSAAEDVLSQPAHNWTAADQASVNALMNTGNRAFQVGTTLGVTGIGIVAGGLGAEMAGMATIQFAGRAAAATWQADVFAGMAGGLMASNVMQSAELAAGMRSQYSVGQDFASMALGAAFPLAFRGMGVAWRSWRGSAAGSSPPLGRTAELRARYTDIYDEYVRFRAQGFNPAQARYLAQPYDGMGHHFPITRSMGRDWNLPGWIIDSPFNVLRPANISIGRFYELHYAVDPSFYRAGFPRAIGGQWVGGQLGLEKYGTWGRWWYGTSASLKLSGGAVAAGGTAAGVWFFGSSAD
jgi:RHS repeat-associated protein